MGFGCGLEGIYGQVERWPELGIKTGSRIAVSLRENHAQAKRFRQILRLHRRVPLRYAPGALCIEHGPLNGVMRSLERLGLGRAFAGALQRMSALPHVSRAR